MSARLIIEKLGLERHPEGGWYKQTYKDDAAGRRAISTAIFYLLEGDDRSHWHRVDATEIWHFYTGAPLELCVSPDGRWTETLILGSDVLSGELPQLVVQKGHWQSARSLGDWTLAGCTVAPGFEFSGFELAPPGWRPDI